MEKCIGCRWNEDGMICPQHTFCGKSLAEHDKQIRAEVIEEFAKRVKALRYDESIDGGRSYYVTQRFCDRDIDEIAEQLKENNDR